VLLCYRNKKEEKVKAMKESDDRKTTHVRVTTGTKAKIDALCKKLKWDQQTVIDEAVSRKEGKVEIVFKEDKSSPEDVPGHQSLPPLLRARMGGASRFSAKKSEKL
jgi:hypothetical protein